MIEKEHLETLEFYSPCTLTVCMSDLCIWNPTIPWTESPVSSHNRWQMGLELKCSHITIRPDVGLFSQMESHLIFLSQDAPWHCCHVTGVSFPTSIYLNGDTQLYIYLYLTQTQLNTACNCFQFTCHEMPLIADFPLIFVIEELLEMGG